MAKCRDMQRRRHQEFVRFLNAIEAEAPAGKLVHAILDNDAAHEITLHLGGIAPMQIN